MLEKKRSLRSSFIMSPTDPSTRPDNCTNGETRLMDGVTTPTMVDGRLEVCINNAWGTVCGDGMFDVSEAEVACSTLNGTFQGE